MRPVDVHLFLELPLSLGQFMLLLTAVFAGAAVLILAWQGMELVKIRARRDPDDDMPHDWIECGEPLANSYREHWKS